MKDYHNQNDPSIKFAGDSKKKIQDLPNPEESDKDTKPENFFIAGKYPKQNQFNSNLNSKEGNKNWYSVTQDF